jgi:hypothetical protein
VVGVHRGADTGGVASLSVGVSSRPPLGLVRHELEIYPPTIDTNREVIINVILFTPATRLAYIISVLSDLEVDGIFPRAKRIKIGPNLIQDFTHFELKL